MFDLLKIIFNMITGNEKSDFKEPNQNQIIEALERIKNEFGKEIAQRVEQIFRLETANFKSDLFKKTNSAGLLWNEKYFSHRDKFCIWVKEVKDPNGNLIKNIIVPEGTEGSKRYCYVVFPNIYDGMRYLAVYLRKYGLENGTKRWGGGDAYLAMVKKIQTKFV